MQKSSMTSSSSSNSINTSPSKRSRATLWVSIPACIALAIIFFVDISVGSVKIPLADVLAILFGGEAAKASWEKIVFLFRLPKAVTAALAGAALSMSGLQMQTLFKNPLAGPSILGIGAGASLGVALVVLTAASEGGAQFLSGLGMGGDIGVAAAASLGSGLVLFMILLVSRRVQSVITLLILGMLFGFATNALVSILIHFSVAEKVHTYIAWTFGTFQGTTWNQLLIFIPVIGAGLAAALFGGKNLNALLLGEEYARSMGLRVKRARVYIIVFTALLTGTVTAFCGPIAFLGVAVPHLCRSLFNTADHRVLLPTVIVIGAILALVSDIIAGLPGSQTVLPLNSVTALIGTPVIVWIILRKQNVRETFTT
jgi:iron complex transport system permease protein